MKSPVRFQWLDGSRRSEALQIARLHRRLLPESPLAVLGEWYIANYYRLLPRLDLVQVLACLLDETVVGFVAVTPDADRFMQRAFRRAPLRLIASLVIALASNPRRLVALREATAISIARAQDSKGGGELLSFAVDESVRGPQFIRETGVRVSSELINRAIERLQGQGVTRIRSLVNADNQAVRILYGALGWRLAATTVPGWRTPQVEFVLEADSQAGT